MANLVTVATLQELNNWLARKKISTDQWGKGQMKGVEDLWSELRTGESVLTNRPPRRRVSCVALLIRWEDKQLLEVGQELANGVTRQRRQSPAEKMYQGEDPKAAAFRCVEEELGIEPGRCRIVPARRPKKRRNNKVSPSYPGLRTRYLVHEIEMEVPGLPRTAFHTTEAAGSKDTAVVRHLWDWCRP